MSKKILNLVLSHHIPPYDSLCRVSMETWDSIEVEDVETIYYFSKTGWQPNDRFVYLNVADGLFALAQKTIAAFEWALAYKEFDYLTRPHSCIYVNKKSLKSYVQSLPCENLFAGAPATSINGFKYLWGGIGWIFSKDVIEKLVQHKTQLIHGLMEDEAISVLATQIGIPYSEYNQSCSIDKTDNGWQCTSYCGRSKIFTDFSDLKELNHSFYRVKQDKNRKTDEHLMRELFKHLQ